MLGRIGAQRTVGAGSRQITRAESYRSRALTVALVGMVRKANLRRGREESSEVADCGSGTGFGI